MAQFDDSLLILDGGLGRHLQKIGAPFKQPEWSALCLIEAPQFVTQAHQDFIDAGCDVITTNSYACVPFHIGEERFKERGAELIKLSGKLAKNVKESTERPIKVAGSVPPVFGSYEPSKFKAVEAVSMLEVFKEHLLPYSDFVLAETLSSVEEAVVVCDVFKNCGQPVWMSMTLMDDLPEDATVPRLRSGELLTDFLQVILSKGVVSAILFNCCQPEVIGSAIKVMKAADPKILTGAYANAFGKINDTQKKANEQIRTIREEIDPVAYCKFAEEWIANGARCVGGCCGIGPHHMREVSNLK